MYAKILVNILQGFLTRWIQESQTSFVKYRNILDNIFIFWEVGALVEESCSKTSLFFY